MLPHVDLVVVFRASAVHYSKQQARDDAKQAEEQYTRLLTLLRTSGLQAVGRRGERQGQLVILVRSSDQQLHRLVQRERHSDFLYGLSTSAVPASAQQLDLAALQPSERLRLIYAYVTSTSSDGGLGVHPDDPAWTRVESVMALHDPEFNDVWIRSLTTRNIRYEQLDVIRTQVCPSINTRRLLFCFPCSYTRALFFISFAGLATYYFGHAYSLLYSSFLFVWSVVFVEYWRIRERIYSVGWGCQGSVRVEKHRPRYAEGHPWWKRELKILASVPVILLFATILFVLLTAIFIFEAFVTTLYTGPGHEYISFAPTVLFIAVIPRFLAVYQTRAQNLTQWENHRHQSTFDASLTTKTFALSAIVAYLGLALSAFIYVPFGETVMNNVQHILRVTTGTVSSLAAASGLNATAKDSPAIFEADARAAHGKLSSARLQNQMFAYTVTNQAINFFLEVGLPFLTRALASARAGKRRPSLSSPGAGTPKKKRVGFEDEPAGGARGEREFLERVRREVALPEYDLFADYSEMVTQFGYVALWSTIWPLAPAMALLNNVVELRADAFKIATHCRRPLPKRTDTIGPWLECLAALAWAGALTNAALVYLFRPAAAAAAPLSTAAGHQHPRPALLAPALLLALGASHGYIVLRAAARHVLERVLWVGSAAQARTERAAREVKERYLAGVEGAGAAPPTPAADDGAAASEFWGFDEGIDEIRKGIKEA
ncbi:calcium-activated chloride channel-domain-containing protein [Gloeopeniophorella convolvens]|nr:calcium-activated chloride channel-domain-containing protein [Gloeopeniophorella convolvens]